MLLALAWRNVWRNARRSIITMTALGLGVAGIVSIFSFREIANEAIVGDITAGLVGSLQVHAHGYQDAPAIGLVVPHPQQVEAALRGALPNAKSERRVIGAGLAGSGDRSAPVMVMGLEPGASTLYRLHDGHDLGAPKEVLVGKDLAVDLELEPGSELVLVSQAADGSVANDRYTVAGSFVSSSAEMDANAVALPLAEAQSFFALGEGVHQVVVRLPQYKEDATLEADALRAALDLKSLEALSWSEMLPQMKASIDQKRKNQGVVNFIIFLIVGLGVFNAMTMAVFERTRELGVLGALGTRPRRLLAMVVLEALWQGVLGFTIGVAIAAALLYAMGTSDLSKMMGGDVMGVRMPTHLDVRLLPGSLKGAAITAFVTALAGALLPAVRAMRLKPVEALRHT
jgi:ABC-type lipoprotein release transport system permease subunit